MPDLQKWDCISRRFARNTQGNEGQSLNEFEDLRHLYAHNYAGEADAKYFKHKRHVFVSYVTTPLTCAIRWPPTVARSAPPSEVRQHSTECAGTLSVNVVAAPYATNSQCRIKPPFLKDQYFPKYNIRGVILEIIRGDFSNRLITLFTISPVRRLE